MVFSMKEGVFLLVCLCLMHDGAKVTGDPRNCVFPFNYDGKTYNKCTYADSGNNYPWCAYDRVYSWLRWDYCECSAQEKRYCSDRNQSCKPAGDDRPWQCVSVGTHFRPRPGRR
ncbi:epididymal sperm-binding protein 1-like [Oculina patagonica]